MGGRAGVRRATARVACGVNGRGRAGGGIWGCRAAAVAAVATVAAPRVRVCLGWLRWHGVCGCVGVWVGVNGG